jgi:adenosylcobyric acid synthase
MKASTMAKALMIQGTGSGAGKSLIAAALCRIFSDEGMRVAPFKAQNMALNSYITREGGEIGRAQALQAAAARVVATTDMNPVLLKASGEAGSQVVIQGKAVRHMKAREYYAYKQEAWKAVKDSFRRLSQNHDMIVMEGAGSPAEINLMKVDIVNMAAAKMAKAPVLLVGDIDKGGVFASLYGTVKLLGRDATHIKGFLINKFRGDMDILAPGLDMILQKTGKPVIGVLPYAVDLGLPEEDGLALTEKRMTGRPGAIRIVVVRLKYIANFTDFDPLSLEPDVELIYSRNPADIENADLLILPGTKNTVQDLLFLKESGLDQSILSAYAKGIAIIGLCGGYQMLGSHIFDPLGVESGHKEIDGLGLLNIETTFEAQKITCQVEAEIREECWDGNRSFTSGEGLRGYEIHMGRSTGEIGLFSLNRLSSQQSPVADHQLPLLDGSRNGNCWGTYLHGIFENNSFRRCMLDHIRKKKGLGPLGIFTDYGRDQDRALDRLADLVKKNVDMQFIKRTLGL